jgi:2-oxoglutarate ferredoxin oxidoreductase subunit beta
MTDDGFNLGVLYRGDRPIYGPARAKTADSVSNLEEEFVL